MAIATVTESFSLEDFMANPPEQMEWVNGQLVEKTGMTVKHSRVQCRLGRYWGNYIQASGQGGETHVELPCRTLRQGRRPDVSYLTPELLEEFGEAGALPQSPPLIAEIASPTDPAEELFAKASEYLESGCQEVWLVFPESCRVLIITQEGTLAFKSGDIVSTQVVLTGFSVAINELLA
ncbi:Uma2 family endonuclease [Planktothrix sp. FACHB-1355]|uniref:Uma2 family endonuclease n=1 Tax=Aerosakkonema funiforme FACHB-1375 TaxID=2949571 RepID=A0A926ZGN9_9CYAN|nr:MULTISPECIES: Uma2 family endonuclease [Oscillatoriales]MBD2182438.1 Uma2 family endonuclease [Aerosakkonema funiforme FACHB-1375]MBD3558907.1 Uma2 family endonuclease [Planktothrix sp. FACHB-1355]